MPSQPERQTPFSLDPSELELRVGLCTRDDTTRGMFFNGAVNAIRKEAGEATVQRCLSAAGQSKFVDFFSYPVADFLKLTFAAAELMKPALGSAEAVFRRLGQQAVEDFLSSAVGKTLSTLAGKNPRRLVASVPSAYQAAVSYGERSVTWIGEKHCRIVFRHDFMVHPYHEGVLAAGVSALGGRNVQVEGRWIGPLDSDYIVRWD